MEQNKQQNMPKGFGFGSASTPVDAAAVNEAIFRLPPFFYMHVLDLNKNVTRIETGPKTYIRQDNERVTLSPSRMITVPPRHYCVIENPVVRDAANAVVLDNYGQAKLHHADLDVRLTQDPFPLHPGEVLKENVQPLRVVPADSALLLKAVLDFDADEVHRVAGDEWLFEGPGTYVPRKEAHVETTVRASVVKPNQALKLRARRETTDRDGTLRVTGEEWLVSKVGAYLPGAYEEVVETVDAVILTEKKALHIEAVRTFTDQLGVLRRSGEQWLVTMKDAEAYIPGVYEVIVEIITITTLTNREYCVVLNPVDSSGKPQLGKRRLVKGPQTFFLLPGETLQDGIQAVFVLGENEGLILRANEAYTDSSGDKSISRQPGDRWMIRGPLEYVPPVEVEVLMMRQAIPLDENEGIYVRDVRSGRVRAVVGETYMLTQDEELWEKVLPKGVEELLPRDPLSDRGFNTMQMMANMPMQQQKTKKRENIEQQRCVPEGMRDRTKVVSYRVPHNAAVQIYDYKEKNARVVFGPDLVMLGPDEHFTTLSLSGGKPKKPNVIKSLCLLLGPDFCTDIITVETADHARLQLQLAYNWNFRVSRESAASNATSAARLFSVPDFVGDMCNSLASRIRGSVAAVNFDDFHKNSARIIRSSVFGFDEQQKVRDVIEFEQNELCVTNVDIQGVEPIDQRTRDALQKSVQLAIEITTNSQEATAKHEAQRLEQEAKGRLERQRIADSATAEKTRKELLELQAASAAVESTGQAKAEALSQAEAAKIEAQAAVDRAKLKAQAAQIEAEENLRADMSRREAELKYATEQNELEITKARELAAIETKKTSETIAALGTETIRAIATAGPEMQVRLLQSLGIRSTLITDGKTPINLLQTAQGLIGGPTVHEPEE